MNFSLMIKIATLVAIFASCVSLPIDNGPRHKSGHLDMLLFQKQALSEAQQTTDLQLTSLLPVEKKGELKEANEAKEGKEKEEGEKKCLAKCHAEEGGEAEKGEKKEAATTGTVMLCCILAVIVVTVLFETAEHKLVHHTPKTFLPVLTALFSELTVNGFIGVLVFFLTDVEVIDGGKKSVLKWLSGQLFSGEERWEMLPEIFEKVHMIIFANMLVLMITTVGGLALSIGTRTVGQKMEEYCHDVLAQQNFNRTQAHLLGSQVLAIESKKRRSSAALIQAALQAEREKKARKQAEKDAIKHIKTEIPAQVLPGYGTGQYFHLRQRFVQISQQEWDFDFASYCSSALSHVFIETIEIPKMAWLLVAVFISGAWAVEHFALGDNGTRTAALIVGLDYLLLVAIASIWQRTVWMRKQLSPAPPQYPAGQQPEISESWTSDQQAVWEEWSAPPIEAQVWSVFKVGSRVEHATKKHTSWKDTSGLGTVTAIDLADERGTPLTVKYDTGDEQRYSALGTLSKIRKVHHGKPLLDDRDNADLSVEGEPLNPKLSSEGDADGMHFEPTRHLYFGMHEGAEKLQVVLTTVLLLSCTYISVLFCLMMKTLGHYHAAMVVVAFLPIIPQLGMLFLSMRNFSLCGCLEFEINHSLKKKIARNCKLRKTIDQLHRLVQLKDLAMHVGGKGETAPGIKKVALEDIDPSEKRIMHDLFSLVDADHSGGITADEMRQALTMLGHDLDLKSIEKLVNLMDSDGGGDIGFAEFAGILEGVKSVYTSEVALGSDEFIQMLFSIFDDDGAGTITFDEVAAVLTKFGSWDMAEMSQLFREMDSEGSGDVDMEEFSQFVKTILEG